MNANPTAEQARFQNIELREMYDALYGGRCENHHIFGSKAKFKLLTEAGIKRAGEWFVVALHPDVHKDIDNYSFDAERGLFLKQQRDYQSYFGRPSPVPQECIDYYKLMISKHQGVKSWYVP